MRIPLKMHILPVSMGIMTMSRSACVILLRALHENNTSKQKENTLHINAGL